MSTKSRRATFLSAVALLTLGAPSIAYASSTTTTSTTTTSTSPATAPSPDQVIVSGFSEKGDFIDNGVSSVFSTHWAKVSATTSDINLSYFNEATKIRASYNFAPVAGQTFTVGNYDNVQRAAYRSAGFPGIEITGPGRPTGCTRVTGSFHIWDVAASANGAISRLDLTYVEHCGAGRPSNYGEVLVNDAPHLGALVASARRITFPDQTPTLPYVVTNPTGQPLPISLWQSATTVSHFTITPARPSCALRIPAHSFCTYSLRLLPPKPGNYKATVLEVSGSSILRLPLSGPAGGV